jgi:hypothetical protein
MRSTVIIVPSVFCQQVIDKNNTDETLSLLLESSKLSSARVLGRKR